MPGPVTFSVSTEAELDAAIAAIDIGGSATDTAYQILLTADITLTAKIAAIDLAAGDTLTIQGDNTGNDNLSALIDGDGTYRGFVVDAGSVDLTNMSLTGLTAPGGTLGSPAGGGALYVGANASVVTSAVTFNGDTARGGTPAGGAIFVASGGTLDVAGGSVGGGGNAAGNGIFIQGNGSVTLTDTTVTGVIADQTGSSLGSGSGSVVIEGAVTLSDGNHYTGGTQIDGSLSLLATGAAGTGAITFSAAAGEMLIIGAGDGPANLIGGFVPNAATGQVNTDTIDLVGIGAPVGYSLSATNNLTVSGSQGAVTLNLDPAENYAADTFVLAADSGAGAAAGTSVSVLQSGFLVASEADLNATLSSIDVSGKWAAPGVAYTITLTASFSLSSDLDAIDLGFGDTLTIDGAGNAIDGANTYRGFFDYAGGLTLKNLTIQNAAATGGAGGSGALPGGGGAGLGGGLFVASGGATTLIDVTFANDQAAGGAAGTASGAGFGGGGGLGGAGGAGGSGLAAAGGGGGIGVAATGGTPGGVTAGGAGIVVGAAAGDGGTGNHPAGGAGGAFGGGGGAAGITVTSGSGRGGGGSHSEPGFAGDGGVGGGFGGGGASGKTAGFGGGGANSAGGWGGGGSGNNSGGFGGGAGAAGGGGGGLGAGGGVFVQQGGSLRIAGGAISGGSAVGGAGTSGNGAAFGSGIFIQGNQSITLAGQPGQPLVVGDVIADMAGSVGGTAVAGSLVIGSGTVDLTAANTFTGGVILQSGATLSLGEADAAGTGTISFVYGGSATLIAGSGDIPANIISGVLPGDVIDLKGIGLATSALLGAGDVLAVTGGTIDTTLKLDPSQNFTGESFLTQSDLHGGTDIIAVTVGNDYPPSISGAGITVEGNDATPFSPLSGVAVSDTDAGQTESVTLTLSATVNGTLSNLGIGSYDPASGVYTASGSAADVTAALEGLMYTPTAHEVAPEQAVQTGFSLSVTDGTMFAAATDTIDVTALNNPPVITGAGVWHNDGYFTVPMEPFAGVTISDPDLGATETVTITLANSPFPSTATDANGLLSLPSSVPGVSLSETATGIYTLAAGSPSAITQALDALTFTPLANPAQPGFTITYLGLSVSDGTATTTAENTVLARAPVIIGTLAGQQTTDSQTIDPFSTVTLTDSPGVASLDVTITLTDVDGNPTDADGTLSGAGLTEIGVGLYALAAGSPTQATAALEALVFTPTPNQAPPGQTVTTDFLLSVFDGASTSDDGTTSVIVTESSPACFCRGTLILTARGEVPIEELAIGDNIVTASGTLSPISWIGRRTVAARAADPLRAWPVRIAADALADGVPSRDLLLSPDHAIYIDGILVQAGALVNGTSIARETAVPQAFVYYHIELDEHALILADNVPSETFIDNVDRLSFDNWAEHEALHPEGKPIAEMPYPRAKAHRQVPRAIRERLVERGLRLREAEANQDAQRSLTLAGDAHGELDCPDQRMLPLRFERPQTILIGR